MSPRQRIEVRQSEVRERIRGLLDQDERSDEEAAELRSLTAEGQRLEVEYRAAVVAEPEPETRSVEGDQGDAQARELEALRSGFEVAAVVSAAVRRQVVAGREAEYQAERNLDGYSIPLDVFERRDGDQGRETRAITPGPATPAATSPTLGMRPIVPAIFNRSVAPYLGIEMPSVPVGDAAYPILSTSVTAGPQAKGAAAAETAGAFTVKSAQPRRVTGSFRFAVEDAARLRGLEMALRRNLSDVLSDALDNQVLNGSASGDGTVNGLLAQLKDPTAAVPADPASTTNTRAAVIKAFADHVDGLHAIGETGVSALVGLETFRLWAATMLGANSDMTLSGWLRENYGGLRVSNRIPDPTTGAGDSTDNVQQSVMIRQRAGGTPNATMPTWGSLTIDDVISGAAKGERVVTSYVLVGDVVILRSGGYAQANYRTALSS